MNASPTSSVPPWAGWRAEVRRLATLAWPVILGGLGMVTMFAVDTAMVGRLGEQELGAVALGFVWGGAVGLVGRSVIHGLDPVVAQAFGAADREAAGDALLRGFQVALLVSVPVIVAYHLAAPGLALLAQPAELLPLTDTYVRALTWGVPGMMVFWALRQWLQGLGLMRPATWVLLAANLVNVGLNAVLIHGIGNWPGLGVRGCGYATSGSQLFMALGLLWLVRDELRAWWPAVPRWGDPGPLLAVIGIGLPVAVQIGLEVWAFNGAAVMMGWLGTTEVAAHAVALNLAAMAFMVPLGLSAAASTRVGNLLGAGHAWQASGWVAIALGAAVMTFSGTLFVAVPHRLVHLYTEEADVLALAASLLPIAGAFGLFDGIQVVAFGVLRGAGDVRVPSLFNVVGYWLVGLPVGGWLAFRGGWGPHGVWTGLVLSLVIVAILLLLRVRATGRRGGYAVAAGPGHQASAS